VPATASVLGQAASGGSGFGASQAASASGLSVTETEAGTLVTLPGDVLFDFDRHDIRADAQPVLAQLAALIEEDAPSRVEITGHTDSRGEEDYNQALSERRADAARDHLVNVHGLDADLFAAEGRGELEPVAENDNPDGSDNPEGRQRNRRVEVLLVD
jgi:outer membrane protein OmpA-like peptidoglycan-associated protein